MNSAACSWASRTPPGRTYSLNANTLCANNFALAAEIPFHTDTYRQTHAHPLFTTMILAWSVTECIRYAFYALTLLGFSPKPLLWLRYNTFYILYPLGAGSEAFLMASVLPPLKTLPAALKALLTHHRETGIMSALKRVVAGAGLGATRDWGAYELFCGYLFCIWWPGKHIPLCPLPLLTSLQRCTSCSRTCLSFDERSLVRERRSAVCPARERRRSSER